MTAVSGSWVVPTVTGSSGSTSYSAVWVGIDGYSNGTVEQIGTSQDMVNGSPVYQVWWEMYSSGKQQPEQVISGMTIQPGDSITASVQYIASGAYAGDFELSITDTSRANDSFTTYESSAQTQSPAAAEFRRVDRRSPDGGERCRGPGKFRDPSRSPTHRP